VDSGHKAAGPPSCQIGRAWKLLRTIQKVPELRSGKLRAMRSRQSL